jgi:uncharacterized protein (DUF488 family)
LLPEQTQNDILTDLSVMVEQNADLKNEKLEEHLLLDGEKRVVKEEDSGLEKIASLNQEQVGFRTDVIAMITDEN